MGATKKSRKKISLSSGRPPTSQKPQSTLSSKSTRTTIRTYHNLSKRLAQAKAANDTPEITSLEHQLQSLGGLAAYQTASAQGQSQDRGGDTSIELMRWLKPMLPPTSEDKKPSDGFKLLEIGALSTSNACTRANFFAEIVRIDLRARGPGIQQQDFMERPLPRNEGEKFHVLSLSLVLNFVPDARGRGEMLARTREFLLRQHHQPSELEGEGVSREGLSGMLFLVLPAPCLLNSRYFDDERLGKIMASLGFELRRRRQTAKLVYYLWQLTGGMKGEDVKKSLVRDGKGMNNFYVELVH